MVKVFAVCLFIGFAFDVQAQNNASAVFNVVLNDVRSIKVNEDRSEINRSLTVSSGHTSGVRVAGENYLEIASTGNYQVSVLASLPDSVKRPGIITVNPKINADGSPAEGLFLRQVSAGSSDQQIINSPDNTSLHTFFNIEYKVKGEATYISKPAGVYTAVITYQIDPA